MIKKQTEWTRLLSEEVPDKKSMNNKPNWTKGSRANGVGIDIPIRFDPRATGFEIKIRTLVADTISEVHLPLVPRLYDATMTVPLFKLAPAMSRVTLAETMMDERRLEAVLKTVRKKRC
jgi:hypothetical protein